MPDVNIVDWVTHTISKCLSRWRALSIDFFLLNRNIDWLVEPVWEEIMPLLRTPPHIEQLVVTAQCVCKQIFFACSCMINGALLTYSQLCMRSCCVHGRYNPTVGSISSVWRQSRIIVLAMFLVIERFVSLALPWKKTWRSMSSHRILFFGSDRFSLETLKTLHQNLQLTCEQPIKCVKDLQVCTMVSVPTWRSMASI